MRDPARIDQIIRELEAYWKRNPQLRLCQIIGNCIPGDPYYIEDDVFLELLLKQPQVT